MKLRSDVTLENLANVVQQYLEDLSKEKQEAKENYGKDKEAIFDRDLSVAFQLAEDMLLSRLSMLIEDE